MIFKKFNTLLWTKLILVLIVSCKAPYGDSHYKNYTKKNKDHRTQTSNSEKTKVESSLFIEPSIIKGKTYYVSVNGADKNIGLSKDNPIASLSKINQLQLSFGDSILFECNGIWEGQIEIKNSGLIDSPIYFGSYGKGKRPILKGSTKPENWKNTKKNIWSSARNKLESQYWAVCEFNGRRGKLKYSINELTEEDSYFISKDSIYIHIKSNPNSSNVEFSQFQHGILVRNQKNIKIEGLDFRNYGYSGIMLRETQKEGNIIINRCNFYYNKMNAVAILNGHNSNLISNCTARYNGNGFYSIRSHNNIFYKDTIEYSISYSDKGMFTDGHGFGLFRSGDCIVEKCYAFSNEGGSVGFDPDADNNAGAFGCIIRYNHFVMAMSRSACIGIQDVAKNSSVYIYYNLIENSFELNSDGFGIYSGFQIDGDLHVYNNTVIQKGGSHRAVAFRYGDNVHFKNNIIYNTQNIGSSLEILLNGKINSDYNLFYMPNSYNLIKDPILDYNSLAQWKTKQKVDINSKHINPMFVNNTFYLTKESPAINSGVDVGLTKDKDGQLINGLPDIGCFEFRN